jgi:hypothetical protein
MFIQRLSKQSKVLCLSTLITFALSSTAAYAYQPNKNLYGAAAAQDTTNNPPGVCVFDIDNTLIKDSSLLESDLFPGAREAVRKCVTSGYGVAFATALPARKLDQTKNVPYFFKEVLGAQDANGNYPYYEKVTANSVEGNYLGVREGEYKYKKELFKEDKVVHDTTTFINPLYISNTRPYTNKMINGVKAYLPLQTKGDSMNRLMRTFYGYGIGEADVTDPNNAYVIFKKGDRLSPTEIANLSGCLVLFDDSDYNVREIDEFNKAHGTNFQVVPVDKSQGVTSDNVQTGINNLEGLAGKEKTCKKDATVSVRHKR